MSDFSGIRCLACTLFEKDTTDMDAADIPAADSQLSDRNN